MPRNPVDPQKLEILKQFLERKIPKKILIYENGLNLKTFNQLLFRTAAKFARDFDVPISSDGVYKMKGLLRNKDVLLRHIKAARLTGSQGLKSHKQMTRAAEAFLIERFGPNYYKNRRSLETIVQLSDKQLAAPGVGPKGAKEIKRWAAKALKKATKFSAKRFAYIALPLMIKDIEASEDKLKTTAEYGGGMAGGVAGAAAAGAFAGGPIGAVVGGLFFSAAGSVLGEKTVANLWDYLPRVYDDLTKDPVFVQNLELVIPGNCLRLDSRMAGNIFDHFKTNLKKATKLFEKDVDLSQASIQELKLATAIGQIEFDYATYFTDQDPEPVYQAEVKTLQKELAKVHQAVLDMAKRERISGDDLFKMLHDTYARGQSAMTSEMKKTYLAEMIDAAKNSGDFEKASAYFDKILSNADDLSDEDKKALVLGGLDKLIGSFFPKKESDSGKEETAEEIRAENFDINIKIAGASVDFFSELARTCGNEKLAQSVAVVGGGAVTVATQLGLIYGFASSTGAALTGAALIAPWLTIGAAVLSVINFFIFNNDGDSTAEAMQKIYEALSKQIEHLTQLVEEVWADLKREHYITHRMLEAIYEYIHKAFNLLSKNMHNLGAGQKKIYNLGIRASRANNAHFKALYLNELYSAELFLRYLTAAHSSEDARRHGEELIDFLLHKMSEDSVIGLASGSREMSFEDLNINPAENIGLIKELINPNGQQTTQKLVTPEFFERGILALTRLVQETNRPLAGWSREELLADLLAKWEYTRSFLMEIKNNPELFFQLQENIFVAFANVEQAFHNNDQEVVEELIVEPMRRRAQDQIDYWSNIEICTSKLVPNSYFLGTHDRHIYTIGCELTKCYGRSPNSHGAPSTTGAQTELKNDLETHRSLIIQQLEKTKKSELPSISILNFNQSLENLNISFTDRVFIEQNNYIKSSDVLQRLAYKPAFIPISEVEGGPIKASDIPREWALAEMLDLGRLVFSMELCDINESRGAIGRRDPHKYWWDWGHRQLLTVSWNENYRANFTFNDGKTVSLVEVTYPHTLGDTIGDYPEPSESYHNIAPRQVTQSHKATFLVPKLQESMKTQMERFRLELSGQSATKLGELETLFGNAVNELTLELGKFEQVFCLAMPEVCKTDPALKLLNGDYVPVRDKELKIVLEADQGEDRYILDGLEIVKEVIAEITNNAVNEVKNRTMLFSQDQAMKKLAEVMRSLPSELDLGLHDTEKLLAARNYIAAHTMLTELLYHYRNNSEVYRLLGVVCLRQGAKSDAQYFLMQSYNYDPENTKLTCELFQEAGLDEHGPCYSHVQTSGATLVRPPFSSLIDLIFLLGRSEQIKNIFRWDWLFQDYREKNSFEQNEKWDITYEKKKNTRGFFYREKDLYSEADLRGLVPWGSAASGCEVLLELNGRDVNYLESFDMIAGFENASMNVTAACTEEKIHEVIADVKTRLPTYEEAQRKAEFRAKIHHEMQAYKSISTEAAATTAIILLAHDLLLARGYSPDAASWGAYLISKSFSVGRTAKSLYDGADWVTALLPALVASGVYRGLNNTGLTSSKTASWCSNVASIAASTYTGTGFFRVVSNFGVSFAVGQIVALGEKKFADIWLTCWLTKRCDELEKNYNSVSDYLHDEQTDLSNAVQSLLNAARTAPKMSHYALVYKLNEIIMKIGQELDIHSDEQEVADQTELGLN